ncbi:uncharacterized protein JCM15063_000082 [Sporobolomyces koalae]|uniref:uncharacterized protein n=1 Tax=Sporobolomyces koalae TaxID=500713 RepID=UPI003171C597
MPSFKQTVLREPTRSYQSLYQDGNARPTSEYAGSASSFRRGPSSIRSSTSFNSYTGSQHSSASTGPAWVNGQWEWSNFGGRKGLTGGARSLYTPSVVGKSIGANPRNSAMSLRSERLKSDDGGSIRSGRSDGGQSLRSTMSMPNVDSKRRSSARDIRAAVEAAGRPVADSSPGRRARTQSATVASTGSTRRTSDSLPSISSSFDQGTSRRYASAPISNPASSRPPPSANSARTSTRPSRSKSPLRHHSDENAPSLTSSASSAPSSPPITPANSRANLTSPLAQEVAQAIPRKELQTPETVLTTAETQPLPHLGNAGLQGEAEPNEDVTLGASRRFYSVDEFFAIAGNGTEGPAVLKDPSPEAVLKDARTRNESDNTSYQTANDAPLPSSPTLREQPSVPRLKLTRTESDQLMSGIEGPVDLSDEENAGPTAGAPALGPVQAAQKDEQPLGYEAGAIGTNGTQPSSPELDSLDPSTASSSIAEQSDSTDEHRDITPGRPSASALALSSFASDDLSDGRSRNSSATSASQADSHASTAAVDVPDWLQRIRALGDPIDTQQPRIPLAKQKSLNPPPHWAVRQLKAQEQNNSNRPNMVRPRSVGSLRSRKTGALYGLPDVAEEEEPAVPAFPAWLPKKGQDLYAPPHGNLSRASSVNSATSSAGESSQSHRRSRSMDLAPGSAVNGSPLGRPVSIASTSLSRTPSRTSVKSNGTTGSAKLKGLSKLLQPPLASSKAVREPEPVADDPSPPPRETPVYTPSSRYYSSPRSTTSLRDALVRRDGDSRRTLAADQDDGNSSYGGSQISMMSAPQLSPVRPPRNPARRSSLSLSTTGVNREEPVSYSPVSRPPSRPASINGISTQERRPPAPPAPIFPTSRPASAAPSRAASLSSGRTTDRPLSSYLPPTFDVELSSLAISPRLDVAKKTSKRFSLFRSSSTANTSSARRFDPSLDLLYERVDANSLQKRLRNDEVLVEAIAVGLDRWDVEKTWSTAKTSGGAGWVPGRAVYGKVLARGEGITRVKKGDLVWGLTTLKHSSTLASLVTLSRDNVSLAPQHEEHGLDEIAALPADAVTAMQVMETYTKQLPKGSKILILNAHQGIGYLCLQLAQYFRPGTGSNRDLWVVGQVPMAVIDGEQLCRNAGATDVLRDEPLAAINGLHEGSFDVVIDTIGGRRLYDASRRILHNSGSFVSTVGDSLGSDSASSPSNYQNSLRSLRRTFFKKDKKSVHYWLASHEVDEREAVRDVLDKVKEAVEAGALQAKVSRSLAFSEARQAFDERVIAEDHGAVIRIKEL